MLEVGKQYKNRNGKIYRVICNNLRGMYPVVAVQCGGDEESAIETFTAEGFYTSANPQGMLSLIPQPIGEADPATPLGNQVGGDHYRTMKIRPVEFIHANGIPFIEGCVITHLCRHREKGGVENLKKARLFLDLLIEFEASEKEARDASE